ncbi:hypothetical protein AXF42_Ash014810 [Apostasia shenzhenica]|uniref:Uncharacterized protein n=1 Tax=Apostasia shenzhenica TaxID=1088818 RepID=A0A2H9ZWF9_9ASPA|nr:hypothetical protein AXF42_Ash014810 [Apostasia shenzhenica]
MWTPTAMRKMVMKPKKKMVWMKMERPLVRMLTNSTALPLPGIWQRSPGVSRTNSTTAITTGPQSAISLDRLPGSSPSSQ